jgi:hypothetical protein
MTDIEYVFHVEMEPFRQSLSRVRIRIESGIGTALKLMRTADPQHRLIFWKSLLRKHMVLTDWGHSSRVSDPYSFDPDPNPAFEAGDQSGSGLDPDPGL